MSVIDELCDLLDEERACLLTGDIDGVARRIDLKMDLIDRMPAGGNLTRVQGRLVHNATLMKAAMKGIRQAKTQILEARSGGVGRQTYGPDGVRKDLFGTPRLEQRL